MNKCILGIDTSNYRTSVALVDLSGKVLESKRQLLEVKKGERGLRQSDALFQHIKNIPGLLKEIMGTQNQIVAVSYSSRPRPVEGSYMPVFLAGQTVAESIAASLKVPCYEFSHQEGHIAAAKSCTEITDEPFISFHFSGGTTECLLCKDGSIEKVGGTLDISFGQIVDRIGVKLGYNFPCGEELDQLLLTENAEPNIEITKVKIKKSCFNLSGLETQLLKLIEDGNNPKYVVFIAFSEIARIMNELVTSLGNQYKINDFIFAGGVSSSKFIRNMITSKHNLYFAPEELSGDNAVGVALLGGLKYGQETGNNITTE